MPADYKLYIHEDDRTALEALESIPGFSAFAKAFMKGWNENQFRILNMSSRLRISDTQLPKYWAMLEKVSAKLGIATPELYLEMNPVPNAYTYGDTAPFIVMTSGLLESIPEELIPTVLAHECGHIVCHHTLYRTMGQIILGGTSVLIPTIGPLISLPLKMAFAYWMRCSEYSADRAAALYEEAPEKIVELCMRLSGYTKNIDDAASIKGFLDQGHAYRDMIQDSKWNQSMEFLILASQSHPLTAVRALEIYEWGHSAAFQSILRYCSEEAKGLTHTEIPVSKASEAFHNQPVQDVSDELKALGFDSITVHRITEAVGTREGTVHSLAIGGTTAFPAYSWFPVSAEIEIEQYLPLSYEEERQLHPGLAKTPSTSEQWISQSASAVEKQLIKAGFTNIISITEEGSRPLFARTDAVRRVTINGDDQFEKGIWIDCNAEVRIYHYGH